MPRNPGRRFTMLVAVAAAALNAFVIEAAAADFTVGNIQIGNPWTRATPKGADVAGGYMKITNKGSVPDSLIGGSSAAADRFEVHEMSMVDGVMKMRPLAKGLEVKPGETVELKPGSFHIMLMGLKQPLEKGRKVKGTLIFEKAGKVDIEYTVEALGAGSSAPGGHGHGR
jgi:periplasmic copper chaperone A